ncbi:hypothetical protein Y1Q_0024634 [Alligator mississippiensis]|uniref:Uncharacterized protein n=1 Tax=Alligator mississippiensis TaxID=8496 RepID=A0A151NB30_ALLMI|nr:hypothetical protein Y1Q_0024634 [Alligator mississippiensis]
MAAEQSRAQDLLVNKVIHLIEKFATSQQVLQGPFPSHEQLPFNSMLPTGVLKALNKMGCNMAAKTK